MNFQHEPSFRHMVSSRRPLVGMFAKCFHPTVVEVTSRSGSDFIVLDVEHAPASPEAINVAIIAARSAGCQCLIRLPDTRLSGIQQAVAMGADGIFLPHINDPAVAASALAFARGLAAERAVAGFGRAVEFAANPREGAVAAVRDRFAVIVQVDEPEGISAIDHIAELDADGIFVGRFGLALRHGSENPGCEPVEQSMRSVAKACTANGKAFGMYLPDYGQLDRWQAAGATFFVIGTDIGFLSASTQSAVAAFRERLAHAQ